MADPQEELDNLRAQIQLLTQERDNARNAVPANPHGPQHVVNLKPERPPTYAGGRNESLAAWIFQMERYCQLLPVPDINRVEFAGTFLKDHAAMWWQTTYNDIESWRDFTDGLREQFQPVNTAKTARAQLDRLKQTSSVRFYNTRFRELILQIPHMHEEDRVHHYINGLKPQVAALVALRQPDSLLDAQGLADTADTIQHHHVPYQTYGSRGTGQTQHRPNYQGPAPMELDAIGKLTDTERERLRKNGGCFRCRKTGHVARNCTLTNRQHTRINAIEEDIDQSGKE